MFTAQEVQNLRSSSPAGSYCMGMSLFKPRRAPANIPLILPKLPSIDLQSPSEPTSESPRIMFEGSFSSTSGECTIPRLTRLRSPISSPIRLPSLDEFDQGVKALARSFGSTRSWTPPSPLPSLTYSAAFAQPLPSVQGYASHEPAYQSYPMGEQFLQNPSSLDAYPSPPPEGENRHINQKYTQEEGDFIIYAWHDKKLKWQRIKQDFATMFGRTPERTVQGLQAWYYRMNQHIPLWDEEGWLLFPNEDALEPKEISIKCRERDSQDKPIEPLGLAQRYPDRAIGYSWVDAETKRKSRDWAAKRALQYHERRERRRRKDQRRMKL